MAVGQRSDPLAFSADIFADFSAYKLPCFALTSLFIIITESSLNTVKV